MWLRDFSESKAGLSGLFHACLVGLIFSALAIATAAAQSVSLQTTGVTAGVKRETGEHIVVVRLTPIASAEFVKFTSEHVGRRIQFRKEGTVLADLPLRGVYKGDPFVLVVRSADEAERLALRLATKFGKFEIVVVPD